MRFLEYFENQNSGTTPLGETDKLLLLQDGDVKIIGAATAYDATYAAIGDTTSRLSALEAGQQYAAIGFTTKAAMDADLAHGAGTIAIVTNDATGSNNTYWIKLGASGAGSWQKSAMPAALPFVDCRQYVSLTAAVGAIGSTPATLLISESTTITANTTIPTTLQLQFTQGGSIDTTGYTLTINGPFSAGLYQVFTGTGTVSGLMYAESGWFGTDGAALNRAIAAATGMLKITSAMTIDSQVTVTSKTGLVIDLNGQTFTLTQPGGFLFTGCDKTTMMNGFISDTAATFVDPGVIAVEFRTCTNSGLDNITYSNTVAAIPTRLYFAWLRTTSVGCFVKNCQITGVHFGVQLGDDGANASPYIEPALAPTQDCLVEGNTFDKIERQPILARTRNNMYDLATVDSISRHRILNNTITNMNNGGSFAQSVGIEIQSGYCEVAGNKIPIHPTQSNFMGISLAKAYRAKVHHNEITGAYSYQGIELATVNNSDISHNTIDGVTSADANSAGIGVSVATGGDPPSIKNILADNIILNCKRGVLFATEDKAGQNTLIGGVIDGSTNYGVYDLGSGIHITGITISNSTISHIAINFGTTISNPILIENNTFLSSATYVVYTFGNSAGTGRGFIFTGNEVIDWGADAVATNLAIGLGCAQSVITNNTFIKYRNDSGFTNKISVFAQQDAWGAARHIVSGNTIISAAESVVAGGGLSPLNTDALPTLSFYSAGRSVRMPADAVPTSGVWVANDRQDRLTRTIGQPKGWSCTTGGTPGTWTSEGSL